MGKRKTAVFSPLAKTGQVVSGIAVLYDDTVLEIKLRKQSGSISPALVKQVETFYEQLRMQQGGSNG